MDRRQQKTRDAIFQAFSQLLEKKHYVNITVQDIIDRANIGRSTFYAHFDTKDALLKELCTELFSHVFSKELLSESTHDFSRVNNGLETRLTHLLHHLKDSKNNIAGILSCESGELFMRYFKGYLSEMFAGYLNQIQTRAPMDFVLNHLVGSFAEAVKWWLDNGMKTTPEETAGYFIAVSGIRQLAD